MPCAAEKCSAPKTPNGAAKHKLASATIFSRPRACAKALFTASIPITESTTPAEHVDTTVREISKKISPGRVFKIVAYILTKTDLARKFNQTRRSGKGQNRCCSVLSHLQG